MSYRVGHTDEATEQIRRLSPKPRRVVRRAIRDLYQGPHAGDTKKLNGFDTLWRVRVGRRRIICDLDTERQVITILRVARREIVYEGLEDLVRDDPSGSQ